MTKLSEFVRQQNIARYRHLLEKESDPAARRRLVDLIAREEKERPYQSIIERPQPRNERDKHE